MAKEASSFEADLLVLVCPPAAAADAFKDLLLAGGGLGRVNSLFPLLVRRVGILGTPPSKDLEREGTFFTLSTVLLLILLLLLLLLLLLSLLLLPPPLLLFLLSRRDDEAAILVVVDRFFPLLVPPPLDADVVDPSLLPPVPEECRLSRDAEEEESFAERFFLPLLLLCVLLPWRSFVLLLLLLLLVVVVVQSFLSLLRLDVDRFSLDSAAASLDSAAFPEDDGLLLRFLLLLPPLPVRSGVRDLTKTSAMVG